MTKHIGLKYHQERLEVKRANTNGSPNNVGFYDVYIISLGMEKQWQISTCIWELNPIANLEMHICLIRHLPAHYRRAGAVHEVVSQHPSVESRPPT